MAEKQSTGRLRRARRSTRGWASIVWVVFIVLFFLWQTIAYFGVVALVAEWQFNEFGTYRPALTYVLFILLLAPLPLLFRRRRKRAVAGEATEMAAEQSPHAVRSTSRVARLLSYSGIASFCVALVSLAATLMLPSDGGPLQRLTASDTLPAEPGEGATELGGKILYNRTAAFDENLWIIRRNTRFAPVIEEGADETAIRYFVELAPDEKASPGKSVRRGILKRNGLPGELLRLYRYAGFRVFPNHYVLFSSAEPMRWPYFILAVEFALGGILFLLAALFLTIRARQMRVRRDSALEAG